MLEFICDHLLCNVNNVQFVAQIDHFAPKDLNILPLACTDVNNYRPMSIIFSIAEQIFFEKLINLLS